MDNQPTLDDCVIDLHRIARQVELEIGEGTLALALRETADKISDLIKVDYGYCRVN